VLLKESLVRLTKALVGGRVAPAAYPYDPRNGLAADRPPFPSGAAKGTALGQPATTARFRRARFAWHGGPRGLDRPLDRAFVTIERRTKNGWRDYDSDLGLRTLWEVDDDANYTALWEVPRNAPRGSYRFQVTGNRYGLRSRPFKVVASNALRLAKVPGGVTLSYPTPVVERDLTYRPPIRDAFVGFSVPNGVTFVHSRDRRVIPAPKGSGKLSIRAGAAQDRWGNRNGNAVTVRP
jgi:hypothetical protein